MKICLRKIFATCFILVTLSITNVAYAGCCGKCGKNKPATPEVILPDGVDAKEVTNPFTGIKSNVRKGTIEAVLANTAKLDRLLLAEVSANNLKNINSINEVNADLMEAINTTGLFNLFSPLEWLQDNNKPGRAYVAISFLSKYPEKIDPKVKSKIKYIAKNSKIKMLKQYAKTLI